jgi:C4-dicarboxylate-specific signal transduction histidine kinase
MLHFMASQLAEHYQVIQAVDGTQAVEKAISAPPDLILTDMMMPGKDGLEVCKELRAHAMTKNIPIVMITARADEETKLAVLNAGANDFLPKPFSTTELHVRVKNLVDSYRFQLGLERQNKALESALAQLKQMQDQLVTKEKQASLGVWSAGIIHEMNNPLNFARTGLYALRNKDKLLPTEEQGEFREVMGDIEEVINRVHMIVSDLRTYAHPGVEECEEVLVRDVVRMVLRFFSSDVQGYAEVIQKIAPEQTVFVNRNKLIQVLGNLLQNSVDALKTKDFGQGHPIIIIEGREEGGRSKLILHDNGPGIEKQNLDKIFDPFFTTKDVGKGMGLGLGICYRIVQEFGGNITVRSEPGQFCEFTLDFPAERPEPTRSATE